MKRLIGLAFLIGFLSPTRAQNVLTLDSCRALAIANNKELQIAKEKINAAHYEKKAAFTNFLPEVSAMGTYMRNQKEFSLLDKELKNGLANMGTSLGGVMQGGVEQMIAANPGLATNPVFMQLVESLGALPPALNDVGSSIVDAFRTDTRNVYAGMVTLTQPLYMGGKIRAYNKITNYAEELAQTQYHAGTQEVILNTDQAYWQIISLVNKKKMAESYLKLLQKMESDIERMIAEGVATKADGLSIKVKVNEAEVLLTRAENGLSLSRMLLCQLCGLDLTSQVTLADEALEDLSMQLYSPQFDMDAVYANRPETRSLELATNIYAQKVNVVRADYLPSLALMGNYIVTNPSVFNSFENKFKGMWNIGVMLKVPIFHWGQGSYKVKAAKAEARIAQYQLSDAREKIELQVNQSAFKVAEAAKQLSMAEKNMEKANENLRYARLGFEEGVIPANNMLEAHTAWLSAQSEKIDAQIEVKLTEVYLQKATGSLSY